MYQNEVEEYTSKSNNWHNDPFFMVAPHLTDTNIQYVYRRLSPTSYREIEVVIKRGIIKPESKLTKSETEYFEKNLL
jgi:hypothetical protein